MSRRKYNKAKTQNRATGQPSQSFIQVRPTKIESDLSGRFLSKYNIISYDIDNLYPQKVKLINDNCSEIDESRELWHTALIGLGLKDILLGETVINSSGMTFYEWLEMVAWDIVDYSGMTALLNLNGLGGLEEIVHVPLRNVRFSKGNIKNTKNNGYTFIELKEEGNAVVNTDWNKNRNYNTEIQEFAIFGQSAEKVIEKGGAIYYSHNKIYETVYPNCRYHSLFLPAQQLIEIDMFGMRQLQNGFFLSGILAISKNNITENEEGESKKGNLKNSVLDSMGSVSSGGVLVTEVETSLGENGTKVADTIKFTPIQKDLISKELEFFQITASLKILRKFKVPDNLSSGMSKGTLSNNSEYRAAMELMHTILQPMANLLRQNIKNIVKNSKFEHLGNYEITPIYEIIENTNEEINILNTEI